MIAIRPYQEEAIAAIRKELSSHRSTLLVLATGLGKTICFSFLAKEMMPFGKIMVLAHREELINQAARKLCSITEYNDLQVEMGADHITTNRDYQPDIIVSTIQTQIAGMAGEGRMTKFDPYKFSLLVIDEAHHGCADSYRKVIDYYSQNPDLKILGVTATPDRADEEALGQIFESVAYDYGIVEGIQDSWLVPIEQRLVMVDGIDLSQVRTTAGDLNGGDLADVMESEKALHEIASPTIDIVGNRKALIFAASVAQAERLTEILNRHRGDSAFFVYAKTERFARQEIFRNYAEGKFQYLVNVGVATEGFDEPSIEVVVMARPTKSRSLYAQMAGRGTRALTGVLDGIDTVEERREAISWSAKPKLEILDFVGNSGRHKLVNTADILGGKYSDEVVARAKENIEKEAKPAEVLSELEKAEQQLLAEKRKREEAATRANLKLKAKFSTAKVNPFDVLDVMPAREKAWHKGRQPSMKQVEYLDKKGVDPAGLSFTSASQLIDQIIKRQKAGMATFKQIKCLRRCGYDTHDMTFEQASKTMNELAANGWKKPA